MCAYLNYYGISKICDNILITKKKREKVGQWLRYNNWEIFFWKDPFSIYYNI
jgi:hypothetical protein